VCAVEALAQPLPGMGALLASESHPRVAAARPLEQFIAEPSHVPELDHRVAVERNQNPAKPCGPL
jgi:hypothetical protein